MSVGQSPFVKSGVTNAKFTSIASEFSQAQTPLNNQSGVLDEIDEMAVSHIQK